MNSARSVEIFNQPYRYREDLTKLFDDIIKKSLQQDNTISLLKKGIPVYIKDSAIKEGNIKIYPNGQKEVIKLDKNFEEVVVYRLN